jgi:hypothetical protein
MPSKFASSNAMGMPTSGLASRRAAQHITPLPLSDAARSGDVDAGAPTPRTSRSHLLAGLRTAPRTSTATNFPASPTVGASGQQAAFGRSNANAGHDGYYNAPRTAHPFFGGGGNSTQAASMGAQYTTADQNMRAPEIRIQDGPDEADYAQMVGINMYLAQQQQQLQQHLMNLQSMAQQSMAQQFQGRHDPLSQQQLQQQQYMMYAQQLQITQMQQQLAASQLPSMFAYVDPATGQQILLTPAQAAQLGNVNAGDMMASIQGASNAPMVQVSPPTEHQQPVHQQHQHQHQQNQHQHRHHQGQGQHGFRTGTPPKRFDSPVDTVPLPPPSANAFRRGHKKAPSLAHINSSLSAALSQDAPRSAGPRTPSFPQTPLTGGFMPGQNRAGEHPIRQPRNPPPMDELVAKPTAKHEGSKNFAARTRRSAVSSLVRAGLGRRNGTSSSIGSVATSPTSETADGLVSSPVMDDSDSERSGSGSLSGDIECSLPSSRSSASSTWGAIGSDRPSSRQKSRQSVDSVTSACDSDNGTFANVFKNAQRATKETSGSDVQRKGAKLVLTKAGVSTVA